jgi:hypothetical protein
MDDVEHLSWVISPVLVLVLILYAVRKGDRDRR